jgi:hypothetical protein
VLLDDVVQHRVRHMLDGRRVALFDQPPNTIMFEIVI